MLVDLSLKIQALPDSCQKISHNKRLSYNGRRPALQGPGIDIEDGGDHYHRDHAGEGIIFQMLAYLISGKREKSIIDNEKIRYVKFIL
jgi:hypothetical protein